MAKPILLKSAAELLQRILGEKIPADRQMESYFRAHRNMGVRDRALEETGFQGDARAMAERVRTLDRSTLPFAALTNLPDWLAERLHAQFDDTEVLALALALNQPAPVDLRVNTVKA
jgi:16S rRNA (cytosine967-C5)-methyltransferase